MIKITLPLECEDRQPVKDLAERLMGRDPLVNLILVNLGSFLG
jgi:hypothetical protein